MGDLRVFSVAVRGYGVVIWDGDGEWRTFGATDSLCAILAARVEVALQTVPLAAADADVREALLGISGASLLSEECGHGPGECDGAVDLS